MIYWLRLEQTCKETEMQKVKVTFPTKMEIGGVTLEGEMSFSKPDMGVIIDAGSVCPPSNQLGFGAAVMGAIIDVPYASLRAMEPAAFMQLQKILEPLLPKM